MMSHWKDSKAGQCIMLRIQYDDLARGLRSNVRTLSMARWNARGRLYIHYN